MKQKVPNVSFKKKCHELNNKLYVDCSEVGQI